MRITMWRTPREPSGRIVLAPFIGHLRHPRDASQTATGRDPAGCRGCRDNGQAQENRQPQAAGLVAFVHAQIHGCDDDCADVFGARLLDRPGGKPQSAVDCPLSRLAPGRQVQHAWLQHPRRCRSVDPSTVAVIDPQPLIKYLRRHLDDPRPCCGEAHGRRCGRQSAVQDSGGVGSRLVGHEELQPEDQRRCRDHGGRSGRQSEPNS